MEGMEAEIKSRRVRRMSIRLAQSMNGSFPNCKSFPSPKTRHVQTCTDSVAHYCYFIHHTTIFAILSCRNSMAERRGGFETSGGFDFTVMTSDMDMPKINSDLGVHRASVFDMRWKL
jgi:hypothetical protein